MNKRASGKPEEASERVGILQLARETEKKKDGVLGVIRIYDASRPWKRFFFVENWKNKQKKNEKEYMINKNRLGKEKEAVLELDLGF